MASLKTTTRNKAIDAITTDAGATAFLYVYSGAPPAKTANNFVAPTGTLLAKLALSNPIAPAGTVGVLTFSAITSAAAVATGTPGYYRVGTAATDTDGTTVIMQGISAVGSGELNFASTIVSGGTVSVSSFTVTEGNA